MSKQSTVLVLGASGMLGHAVLRFFAGSSGISVYGSVRSGAAQALLPAALRANVITGVDVDNWDSLVALFARAQPDVVINCVGLVKQLAEAEDPLAAIPINSLLPHRLSRLCAVRGARLVHISTDCVFAGTKGMYKESDPSDAQDLYGRSKFLGEVSGPGAVTLRTSIIGPELNSAHGLLGWFLAQSGRVRGFSRAIFSGLPTVELARVIRDFVLPNPQLQGLYHVAAAAINKYELLRLIAADYGRTIEIAPDAALVIDRSLDGGRFSELTGYVAPPWPELVRAMHAFG
ncbi:MAG: SDR family oxidoreductase [Proteobacteria bacterium]|nr:SDR family oxidoreductase [Pseudomonadota bacterium]